MLTYPHQVMNTVHRNIGAKYRSSLEPKDHSGFGFVKKEIDHNELRNMASMLIAAKGWELLNSESSFTVSPATELKLLVKLLRTVPVFALTPKSVIVKALPKCELRLVPAGTALFGPGDLFCVLRGQVPRSRRLRGWLCSRLFSSAECNRT